RHQAEASTWPARSRSCSASSSVPGLDGQSTSSLSMTLRIGTRRSRLALAQAKEVASRLSAEGVETELVPIVTSGDRGVSSASSPAGLKGLFVAEIVTALQRGEVDLAVHSAKDL